jgi:hypothetical protein
MQRANSIAPEAVQFMEDTLGWYRDRLMRPGGWLVHCEEDNPELSAIFIRFWMYVPKAQVITRDFVQSAVDEINACFYADEDTGYVALGESEGCFCVQVMNSWKEKDFEFIVKPAENFAYFFRALWAQKTFDRWDWHHCDDALQYYTCIPDPDRITLGPVCCVHPGGIVAHILYDGIGFGSLAVSWASEGPGWVHLSLANSHSDHWIELKEPYPQDVLPDGRIETIEFRGKNWGDFAKLLNENK